MTLFQKAAFFGFCVGSIYVDLFADLSLQNLKSKVHRWDVQLELQCLKLASM